jgi:broad specificity phosphatase PhoE
MPRLVLVRHGRATGGWDDDPDPGLDDLGRSQAAGVASRLSTGSPVALWSSPLRRCRETAAPLAERWSASVAIEPRVAELPSPPGVPLNDRVGWLKTACQGTWTMLGPLYEAYRADVVAALIAQTSDAVIFSHFIAINAVIGAATGDDRVVIASLDNTSCTIFETDGTTLRLVDIGSEAATLFR